MKLFYSDTLAPRKVCAAARYLKAPVEYIYVDLGKGEHVLPAYLTLNPNGKVPVLAAGEKVLWEADAILCELALATGSDLLPRDQAGQIEMIRWFSWNAQHFIRAGGALYFEYIIRPRFGLGEPDQAEVAESRKNFRKYARVLDDHLAGRRWLMGDRLTVADFSVGICLPYAEQAQLPLDDYPNMRRWHDRLSELDGWTDPWPHAVG
jgi:glutathione S-transferase